MTATDHAVDTDGHEHISDMVYIKVAVVLAVLTAIEVFTYFESVHKAPDWLLILVLVTLMVVKFFLVAAYFMHSEVRERRVHEVHRRWACHRLSRLHRDGVLHGVAPRLERLGQGHLVVVPPVIASAWLLFAWQGGDHDNAHDSGS